MSDPDYDIIIVGAGVAGPIIAKELSQAGAKILIIEGGPETPPTNREEYMSNFLLNTVKTPESPYPPGMGANPAKEATPRATIAQTFGNNVSPTWHADLGAGNYIYNADVSYLLQEGPQPFLSGYERITGGTTWHWLGTSLRFLEHDFTMKSTYGADDPDYPMPDWPIVVDDLLDAYGRAEHEIGVSADVSIQTKELAQIGLKYSDGYSYPMQEIPPSVLDVQIAAALNGFQDFINFEGQQVFVTSTPAGRNSQPDGNRRTCAGNTNCIPICPIQAKWDGTVTLAGAQSTGNVTLKSQCVVTKVVSAGYGQPVTGIEYIDWENGPTKITKSEPITATAKIYVIAAHAIETPKLMLMSDMGNGQTVANSSDQMGRNLMDHPLYLSWSLMPEQIFGFRGPLTTSGIESLRDGPFRSDRAAWRCEIGNEGWNFAIGDPWTTVSDFVDGKNASHTNANMDRLFGAGLIEQLNSHFTRQWRMGFLVKQTPEADSRVTINRDNGIVDGLHLPRPVINYKLSEYTRRGFASAEVFSRQVYQMLGATNFTRNAQNLTAADGTEFPNPVWFENPDRDMFEALPDALKAPELCANGQAVPDGFTYFGAGHLVGTYRMGSDAHTSVVDSHSRSWDHNNLFLVGDGVFPTITTANPTLTLAALAMRTADAIKAQLATTL